MAFAIPPLQSGGVMLTYRCDNACRHCHYSCSPKCLDERNDDRPYHVLWQIHSYLTPGGRAARRLAEGVRHYPAEHFEDDSCANNLASTWHFHIDPYGNLFTGHCPGIAVATVDDLHPVITAEEFPFYTALFERGPVLAWQRPATEFEPSSEGYIGKCHFCLELRPHLPRRENPPHEIQPMDMYH